MANVSSSLLHGPNQNFALHVCQDLRRLCKSRYLMPCYMDARQNIRICSAWQIRLRHISTQISARKAPWWVLSSRFRPHFSHSKPFSVSVVAGQLLYRACYQRCPPCDRNDGAIMGLGDLLRQAPKSLSLHHSTSRHDHGAAGPADLHHTTDFITHMLD